MTPNFFAEDGRLKKYAGLKFNDLAFLTAISHLPQNFGTIFACQLHNLIRSRTKKKLLAAPVRYPEFPKQI